MMQVNYDYTFDLSHRSADAIFRVDIVPGNKGSQAMPFVRTGVYSIFASYRGRMPFECLDR